MYYRDFPYNRQLSAQFSQLYHDSVCITDSSVTAHSCKYIAQTDVAIQCVCVCVCVCGTETSLMVGSCKHLAQSLAACPYVYYSDFPRGGQLRTHSTVRCSKAMCLLQ